MTILKKLVTLTQKYDFNGYYVYSVFDGKTGEMLAKDLHLIELTRWLRENNARL